jgi:hypothetical protein
MDDLRQTVSDHLGGLESLAKKIPGYSGYKEKELRREADALLRQQLAAKLAEQLTRAEDMARQMLTGPGLTQLAEMGKGNTRLQTLIDKIKTAAQGYAGFFDAVKVKEDQLDQLYEFDRNLLDRVEALSAALDTLQSGLDSSNAAALAPAVRGYVSAVTTISTEFDSRRQAITGAA